MTSPPPRDRRGLGRGRRGPGLLGTMARTAVVAGTAPAVAGLLTEAEFAQQKARLRG